MQINGVQNYNYNQSFGTLYGVNLASRVSELQNRGMLSSEHLNNFEKIKNDGSELMLDITEKYKILVKGNNKKSAFVKFKFLTLSDVSGNEVVIADMQDIR